jgi:predicted nucleic acid-binding protein
MLLDTNVVSELRKAKSGKTDPVFAMWAAKTSSANRYISVITVQELEIGTLRKERQDPLQGRILREWLEFQVSQTFRDRILAVNLEIARRSASLLERRSQELPDILIAATAYVHNMPVVTRNVTHFANTGVTVVNPWDASHRQLA